MRLWPDLVTRVRSLLFRRREERELDEELRFHVEKATEEHVRRGMDPAEARRRALIELGGVERTKEDVREARGVRPLEDVFRDVRHALRSLRRSPGFSLVVVLTLALGIGANTAMFSVVHAVLIRPLPFPDPGKLVQVWETRPGQDSGDTSPADYLDWRSLSHTFASLASYGLRAGNLVVDGEPARVTYATVSSNFFRTMGLEPVLGRGFLGEDGRAADAHEVVLGSAFWQDRFGGDPAVVGRTLEIDGTRYTVVGVMAPGFAFPRDAEVWTRAPHDVPGLDIAGFSGDIRQLRDAWYFRVVGRLAPGADLRAAQADMDAVAARLEAEHPVSNLNAGVRLVPLHRQLVGDVRMMLWVLFGAVGFVLLIACANVTNLTLVRARSRRGELAVRRALGAGGGRLVSAFLTENLVLSFVGGVLGVLLARWATPVLGDLSSARTALSGPVGVDSAVLFFTLAVCVFAATASSLLPTVAAFRVQPRSALAQRGGMEAGSRSTRRVQGGLVVAECALALVLILGASLAVESLWKLQQVDPGFAPGGLVTARISVPREPGAGPAAAVRTYEDVLSAVRGLPGVSGAALAQAGPAGHGPGAGLRIEGEPTSEGALPGVLWQVVAPGYFETAGLHLLKGRVFRRGDDAASLPVAVVNQSLVEAHWPGRDAIGKRINTGLDGHGVWVTIVGVVADTRNEGLAARPRPEIYRPLDQPNRGFRGDEAMLLLRSDRTPSATLRDVRQVVASVDPRMPVYDARVGRELLGPSFTRPRSVLRLLELFAALAMALGATGIYAVVAYAVRRRVRELGVRAAFGAAPGSLVGLVLRRAMALVLGGLAVGVLGALVAGRVLSGLLFDVQGSNPVALAASAAILICVGLAASIIPALRAARIDPVRALKQE